MSRSDPLPGRHVLPRAEGTDDQQPRPRLRSRQTLPPGDQRGQRPDLTPAPDDLPAMRIELAQDEET